MHSLASAAIFGLSFSSALVAALPTKPTNYGNGSSGQVPFTFPLDDGFPNPNDDQIKDIQNRAHGTLPIAAPNASASPPSSDGITNLEFIAFNELFEVAFFTSLIQNITDGVSGFEVPDYIGKDNLLEILTVVQAQEELHALNANGALKNFGFDPIQPCKYIFPTDNLDDAIALASTFTDVVLGTLQDVSFIFAQNGDNGLVRAVASVIGQEGEQEGFYRFFQKKVPSELPFLTTSVRDFAFTALQGFTVPGSCPNIDEIKLTTFLPLTLLTVPKPDVNQDLEYSIDLSGLKSGYSDNYQWSDSSVPSLVLINSQNVPVVEQIKDVKKEGNTITFKALFPQKDLLMNGLTIAAVTKSAGPFATADDVAKDSVFAPAFIEVN